MPTMPVLGITSRSDPKIRYARRDVKEVAAQSIKTNFPWKSYSKQTSPSPDREGLVENGQNYGEEKPKLFPSQDDKTNAFMDSLAQRINYMTGKIASMGNASLDRRPENSKADSENGSVTPTNSTGNTADKDELQDSGLSSRDGSRQTSELTTPDNDGSTSLTPTARNEQDDRSHLSSPKSPVSPRSPASPLKEGDSRLDAETDACLIEESHRGFSILKSLQERRRRSMVLEDQPDDALPQGGLSAAANSDHLRFMTGSHSGSDVHQEATTPPTKKAEIVSTV